MSATDLPATEGAPADPRPSLVEEEAEPTEDDVHLAEHLLARWDEGRGVAKSRLEFETWNDPSSHGRRFDRFIRRTLGVETSRRSRQSDRIADLQRQLLQAGHVPAATELTEWESHLHHARQAAISGTRIWNDPTSTFRTAGFALMMVTAWNSLAIAILQRRDAEWRLVDDQGTPMLGRDGDERAAETLELVRRALPHDRHYGLRENVRDWVELRNAAAHRHLPALDVSVIPLAQACLLNFETTLVEEFSADWALAEQLTVPLQLAGFRDPSLTASLKHLQTSLPLDVQAVLARAADADPELLSDPTYSLRVAFIPAVPSSGRNPDVVAYFVKPGEVPEELSDALDQFVVLPKAFRPKRPHLGAKQVVTLVGERIPFRFTVSMHTEAARSLRVKPTADGDQDATDPQYCEYVPAAKLHLYNEAWVERLVSVLGTADGFYRTLKYGPTPKID